MITMFFTKKSILSCFGVGGGGRGGGSVYAPWPKPTKTPKVTFCGYTGEDHKRPDKNRSNVQRSGLKKDEVP